MPSFFNVCRNDTPSYSYIFLAIYKQSLCLFAKLQSNSDSFSSFILVVPRCRVLGRQEELIELKFKNPQTVWLVDKGSNVGVLFFVKFWHECRILRFLATVAVKEGTLIQATILCRVVQLRLHVLIWSCLRSLFDHGDIQSVTRRLRVFFVVVGKDKFYLEVLSTTI